MDLVIGIVICVAAALLAWATARGVIIGGLSMLLPRPLPGGAREMIPFATVVACMYLTLRVLHRWGVKRELRERLLTLDVPVCLECGYLLRGLPGQSRTCPECGHDLDIRARTIIAEKVRAERHG